MKPRSEKRAWPLLLAIISVVAAFLFSQNEARAAITVAQVTQAAVTTAAATQATAAFTPVANTLYLMWTIQTIGTGPPTVPTATCANGLAMVQVNTVTFATTATQLKRLTLFHAMKPSGLVNGACTITWGQTTTGHGHVIVGFTGVDTSGTDGSGAVVQSVTGRTDSATAAAGLSITLAALQAGSTTAGGFSNNVNLATSLTAGTGYTAGTGGAFNTPTTSIRAEWNTTGSTTVNMTQSATSHIGGIAVEVKPAPTITTIATGTDPAAATIAPGAAATDVNQFTLQTSSGTEAITSVTVNLSTNSGVGRLAITNNAGTELGFTTSPVAGPNTITVAGMSATTVLTTFKVRVTPLSHALMPAVPGAAYAITAPVTAWAGTYTHTGTDTNPNVLTIDNESPLGATTTSGTAGNANVTLNWTTSASADFNTTSGSVIYRWTTTAGSEVPVEGSTPVVGTSNGTAFVACVISSAASTPLTAVNGTGGSAGCSTTALTNGTAYVYKIFQKDTRGNYDTGVTVTIGTFTPAAPPTATTNAASVVTPYTAMLNGTVSSNGAATTVTFEYGLTTSYGYTIPATPGSLLANAVNTPVSADLIGLNCNTVFHYRVKATNSAGTTNGLDGTFTTGACSAPFSATACAATRYNGDLGCTANDVNITGITLASSISSCVSGTPVSLDLDLTVNFAVPDRWDVGIFIANDGKLPTLLPANGGASSCSVDILPTTPPFLDLDGGPQGTDDTCGDGNGAIDDSALPGGTVPLGDGVKRMTNVTLPCYASAASGGKLFVPFAVSWDNQKSPVGSLCTSNLYPVPNTSSKCNAPASSVSIDVVVLPKIIKTHSGATFNPPSAPITYTITVFNDSGGTLQQSILKDIHDIGLVLDPIVTCATANGSICPAASKVLIEGSGIVIPSANLPNNSSLIFTVTGTLTGSIGQTISNTATVSIGLNTNSSTDSVTLGSASGSKSFAPTSITEGNNSLMTITFTNPTASAVTGVSFLDTYPADLVNAASPGGSTTCGGTPTPTVTASAGGNTLAFSGGTIPANGSCTVSVYVTSATANSYINSVSFTPGSLGSASATLSVTAAVYGGFNACDVAAIPNASCTNTTTPTTSRITTKIAGSAFSLDLVALKSSDGTRNTNYNNTVLVELLDASDNGPSDPRDVYSCPITSTLITTLSPNPSFSNPDNGLITVGAFTVANAYRDVRVRVTNVGGITRKGCSTDKFAIRPASFTLIAQDTDAETAGTARTLNNVVVTGGPVHKAGRPFSFTATAYNAAGTPAPTTNYVNNAGHPSMTLSDCTPAGTACTASFGTFTPGTTSFTSGTLSSNLASYSEVGSFNLTLQDTDFASVDAADTPATCAGYYVCSAATPVGRFVPDHFAITPASPVPGCGSVFTYFGQDGFETPFSITAQRANCTETCPDLTLPACLCTTKNYSGNTWAKLNLNTWTDTIAATGLRFSAATLPAWSTLLASTTAPLQAGSWSNGVGTFTTPPKHQASRPSPTATPVAPTPIAITALPVDADGVTMPAAAALGNALLRFGILRLDNAYGSELLPIRVPVRVLYCYAASGVNCTEWRTNTDDSCTDFGSGVASMDPLSYRGSLAASNFSVASNWNASQSVTSPIANGIGTLVFNRPTCAVAPCPTGSVDLTLNLATNNLSWLLGTWTSTGTWNENPRVRLKFGSPKAPYIYLRERY